MFHAKIRLAERRIRPGAGKRREKNAALCAALVLGLCCSLLSACGQKNMTPASSSVPASEAPSSQAASSGIAAASSEAAPSSEAEASSAVPASASSAASSSRTPAGSVVYTNEKYGLRVTLPSDWKGYKVLAQKWSAFKVSDPTAPDSVFGPEIVIRNPRWTQAKHYQDIPIMIFTPSEWKQLDQDILYIGAAPVGPRELAKNSKYVFALPARYNFEFPEGYEEVDKLIDFGAVTAVEPKP